jgi:hypothetical protein
MQVWRGGAGIAGITHQTQRVANLHGLAGLYKLLIEVGIVKVLAMLGVGKPDNFSAPRRLVYARNQACGSSNYRRAALGKNIDALMAPRAGVPINAPEATHGHVIFAMYWKS